MSTLMEGSTAPMLVEPVEEEVTGGFERRPGPARLRFSMAAKSVAAGLVVAAAGICLLSSSSSAEPQPFLGLSGVDDLMRADEEASSAGAAQHQAAGTSARQKAKVVATEVSEKPRGKEPEVSAVGIKKAKVKAKMVEEKPEEKLAKEKVKAKAASKPAKKSHCVDVPGVMLLAEDATTEEAWPYCSPKWSEDCRQAGCCADWDMKCYEKDQKWAACQKDCNDEENGNDTWTCEQKWPPRPRTHETCVAMCKEKEGCRVAVFTEDMSGFCKLSNVSSTEIVWAADNVNSSLCGPSKKEVDKLVAKVNEQIPWQLPQSERANCSFAGEDCSQTKCCNEYSCLKDFSNCWGYQCYKKTEYFAGCMTGKPPEGWDGSWVGGSREIRVVPPAGSKVQLMGTSLYCFMLVTWDAPAPKPFWSTEKELVLNIKDNGLSIYQCDGHGLYEGYQTERAEWGSFSNIDAFQNTWKQVKEDGNWANFDWTVKVDSDAIFLPARLKQHLDKLRAPAGAAVYVENNDFRFRYMGALEVVSRAAAKIWIEESYQCIRGKHEGGEDFFMKGCMDFLGIDHMIDHDLLSDTYAGQDVHCTNGWVAAFHFHKSIIRWNWCYNEVVCGGQAKTCDEGLEVEYVMDE